MFTGIVEDVGKIVNISRNDKFSYLSIYSKLINSVHLGDSISVNGVCLTIRDFGDNKFSADISPETLKKTAISKLNAGDMVNLERAVTPSTRLGGHLVSGHVDGIGTIIKKTSRDKGFYLSIKADEKILALIINNGSIAIDGVSLTVVGLTTKQFDLMIIPHTSLNTTLTSKKEGDMVNIENDMIGKYVEKLLFKNKKSGHNKIDYHFLTEHGFF